MELHDIENCRVCYETFDENLRPHCLPCGHSYCTGCLHNLFNGGNITCPKCVHVHRSVSADVFPINYDLEECISNYKKLQATSNCVIQRSGNCGTPVQSVDIDTMMQAFISDQKVNTKNLIQANKDLESGIIMYETFLTDEKAKHLELLQKIKELSKLNEVSVKHIDEELQRLPKESELLESLDEDSVMVFMDLSWEGLKRGRILIKLFPGTFHGHQFRILCTGGRGPSYAHSKFHGVTNKIGAYESVLAGNYDNQGGASIIQEFPVIHQSYRHPDVPGTVYTHYLNDASHSAQFVIQTGRGTGVTSDSAFGLVEIGLHILKQATKINDIRDVEITDCGLVLSL